MTLMAKSLFRLILRPQVVVIWLCATIVTAVAGPFGTFAAQSVFFGMLYWGLVIGLSIVLGLAVKVVLRRLWPRLSAIRTEALATLIFTCVFSPMIWWINSLWNGGDQVDGIGFGDIFGFVLLISVVLSLFVHIYNGAIVAGVGRRTAPVPSPAMALLDRLPNDMRGEILALCARDHYVIVFTARGKTEILMRLADAIDLLGDLDGVRVHRSHWVNRAAVIAQKRVDGRMFLVLKNDVEIPVSRSYRAEVAAQFTVPKLVA